MATPQQIVFEHPPRLTGDPARDNAIVIDYLWKYFNASITNGGLLQTSSLSTALQDQFPTLHALGVLPGTGANLLPYFTGESEWALTAFTDDARQFVSKDSVADMVAFLGVSTLTIEEIQDMIGGGTFIQNGTGIAWTYDDGANTFTANVSITQYTDEMAQDAVGGMVDTTLVYVDGTPLLTRAALTGEVTAAQGSNATTVAASHSGSTHAAVQAAAEATAAAALAGHVAAADPHVVYLLADGTRGLSANWDAGSFEIRAQTFQSDVATGTAPIIVASTTKVANLNADLLDDQSGAFYLDSANFTGANWTDLTDGGDTTLHTHTNITGNAATVTVADAGADTTTWPLLAVNQTGSESPRTDAGLTYNASANALTTTTFIGALTGNVTGNVSGTADTVTNATQAAITSAANLATVGTITSGTWDGTDVAVTAGGTGRSTSTTAYGLIAAGTTATGAHQTLAAGATTEILVGGGASALPVWTTATGTGAPARAGSPTFTGTVNVAALTASSTVTLSGTAANIATGSNFISTGGTDAGLSFDGSNNATLSGDLAVNGGDLTTSQTTFNLLNATATTINFGSAATVMRIGAAGMRLGLGAASVDYIRTYLGGSFTSGGASTFTNLLQVDGALTAATGDTSHQSTVNIAPAGILTGGGGEVIAAIATLRLQEPIITLNGGDTATRASTLHIVGAPSEGVNNHAIYVAGGNTTVQDLSSDSTTDASSTTTGAIQTDGGIGLAKAIFVGTTLTTVGTAYIGDTTNADITLGLTINQGANDNQILALKSSDVAHGRTTLAETDTYGSFAKSGATAGGLTITGYSDTDATTGNSSLVLNGYTADTALDTTKSTAGLGAVVIAGAISDGGTSVTTAGANQNLLVIRSFATTRFILDADGDSHQDVGTAWTNFDHLDDADTLNALAYNVARDDDPIKRKFGSWMNDKRALLTKHKLVSFNDDEHPFVNMSKLAMLNTGAIRQLADDRDEIRVEILRLKEKLNQLEAR